MVAASSNLSRAWDDWWKGTRNVELWSTLAWYDIVLRYRRSMLGPLWLTISMGFLLLGMGPLYSQLFNVPRTTFFPHLTLGIIFWNFFTTTINEGCNVFVVAAPYLKHAEFPGSVFVWRSLARNVIQLAHHMVLYIPVAIWAGVPLSPRMLLFIPGMIVVLVNLHAMSITLGIVCARFRDVIQIVTSTLQLLMFLTPVFWFPESPLQPIGAAARRRADAAAWSGAGERNMVVSPLLYRPEHRPRGIALCDEATPTRLLDLRR